MDESITQDLDGWILDTWNTFGPGLDSVTARVKHFSCMLAAEVVEHTVVSSRIGTQDGTLLRLCALVEPGQRSAERLASRWRSRIGAANVACLGCTPTVGATMQPAGKGRTAMAKP